MTTDKLAAGGQEHAKQYGIPLRTKVHLQARQITAELDKPKPDYVLIGKAAVRIAEICIPSAQAAKKRREKLFTEFISDEPFTLNRKIGEGHLTKSQVHARHVELSEKIIALHHQGYSQNKIAALCNCSQTRACSIIAIFKKGNSHEQPGS